jgi:tetratricopeptide (TPR) repeat protein
LRQAEAEALLGDARTARAAADAALALDGQALTRLAAAATFALTGDPRRASRLFDDVVRRAEPTALTNVVWQAVVRALLEAGTGRADQALEALGPAARFERGRHFGLVPLGVRASVYRSAGRASEAAAAFRDLLSLRQVLPLSPWVAFAQLGLARALREAGDVDGSRAAYDAVIEWMKDADQDAPILVAARSERAAL